MSRGASAAELVDQPSCMCLPDSAMPITDCVLLWSDGCRRHEFAPQIFELLSELALEFFSVVISQPSRHTTRSNPVFQEVVPDDFRMLAGNHGNDTISARKVENVCEAQLVTSIIYKHEQIYGCCVTKLSVCAKSCRQVEVQDDADSRTHRIAAAVLRDLQLRPPPVTRIALASA